MRRPIFAIALALVTSWPRRRPPRRSNRARVVGAAPTVASEPARREPAPPRAPARRPDGASVARSPSTLARPRPRRARPHRTSPRRKPSAGTPVSHAQRSRRAHRTRPVAISSCSRAAPTPPARRRAAEKHDGVHADQAFRRAFHGFSAKLDAKQRARPPRRPGRPRRRPRRDHPAHRRRPPRPASLRIGGKRSTVAAINNLDGRVNADVAIVDTGIAKHSDLNVAGGYNCATSDHTAWRDKNDHGTHVAGTVGALDNDIGVVGVAPGRPRLGRPDPQRRRLRPAVVVRLRPRLDPRAARPERRRPAALRGREHVRHQVGHGRPRLRRDATRTSSTRRSAASSPAASRSSPRPPTTRAAPRSASRPRTTRSSRSRPWPTRTASPAGSAATAATRGAATTRTTRSPTSATTAADVDIMAPGKCIWSTIPGGYAYMSGTSMAAPTVTGAVALYKASRPKATPAEVKEALRYLGNLNWKTSTDPDSTHEPLLDVVEARQARDLRLRGAGQCRPDGRIRRHRVDPGHRSRAAPRSSSGSASRSRRRRTGGPRRSAPRACSAGRPTGPSSSSPCPGTAKGTYQVTIKATNQGRVKTQTIPVTVTNDNPTAKAADVPAGQRHDRRRHLDHGPQPPDDARRVAGRDRPLQRHRRLRAPASPSTAARGARPSRPPARRPRVVDRGPLSRPALRVPAPGQGRHRQLEPVGHRDRRARLPGRQRPLVGGDLHRDVDAGPRSAPRPTGPGRPRPRPDRPRRTASPAAAIGLVMPRSAVRGKVTVYLDGVLVGDGRHAARARSRPAASCTTTSGRPRGAQDHGQGRTARPVGPTVSIDGFVVLQ